MIATLSPASYNFDETLSTLRYANRAKNIKNKPKVNEDPKDAMLRQYQEEIKKLREALEAKQRNGGATVVKKVVTKKVTKKIKKERRSKGERGDRGRDIGSGGEEGEDSDENYESGEDEEDGSEDGDEGEEDNQGEDDGEGRDEEADANSLSELDAETIARLEAEVEAEKRALLDSKNIVTAEKERIAAELAQRAHELEKERKAREEISQKLAVMEAKLLIGGVNIVDRVADKERELQETQLTIQQQKRAERDLQQKLEVKQELQLQMEENYASLQDEVDAKSKKLKKLWAKLQAAKAEINDLQDEFRNEREDLLDTIRELSRELGLKVAIIENFIPADESRKIENRATYDDERGDWQLTKLTHWNLANKVKRPCALQKAKRPISHYARTVISNGEGGYRYHMENILSLKVSRAQLSLYV
jgi:kinesin family protein 3/17